MSLKIKIPPEILEQIKKQAEKEYPSECCGFILTRGNEWSRALACRNSQGDYHEKDPENFPKEASQAFWIDPQELLLIQKDLRQSGEKIGIIYHSHIDQKPRLSQKDKQLMKRNGSGVKYLIVSVFQGRVGEIRCYSWTPKKEIDEKITD